MKLKLWKVALGAALHRTSNDGGLTVGLECYKSPFWEVEFTLQTLLPWQLSLTLGQRVD